MMQLPQTPRRWLPGMTKAQQAQQAASHVIIRPVQPQDEDEVRKIHIEGVLDSMTWPVAGFYARNPVVQAACVAAIALVYWWCGTLPCIALVLAAPFAVKAISSRRLAYWFAPQALADMADITGHYAKPGRGFWVAEVAGLRVVGMVAITDEEAVRFSRQAGYPKVSLMTSWSQTAAIRLYERQGFKRRNLTAQQQDGAKLHRHPRPAKRAAVITVQDAISSLYIDGFLSSADLAVVASCSGLVNLSLIDEDEGPGTNAAADIFGAR
ncbi:hypothetical protein WJX72_007566 [[Myrmecia] bisecta]|uniref:N-acetyltransferase domain-containing protein n=1 Tax=[Myrmecia] bisecta TaxID=41462 RepID=A0AAW1PGY8_9CHLO